MDTPRYINLRFSVLQFVYFVAYCSAMAFAVAYLQKFGLESRQVGIMVAVGCILSAVLQPVLGNLVDRMPRLSSRAVILVLSLLGAAISVVLALPLPVVATAISYSLLMIVVQTLQPFVNELGLSYGPGVNFGVSRAMGSISYAISAAIFGVLLAQFAPSVINILTALVFVLLAVTLLLFPKPTAAINFDGDPGEQNGERTARDSDASDDPDASVASASEAAAPACEAAAPASGAATTTGEATPLGQLFGAYPLFTLLLIATFFGLGSHNGINTFLIDLVVAMGGDSSNVGFAAAIAAVVELPAMALYSVIRRKVSCEAILMVASVAFLVKSLLTVLAPDITMLYAVMVLQMLSFALYLPAIVDYAKTNMLPADSAKGQALVMGATTLAVAVTGLVGGFAITAMGARDAFWLWVACAALCVLVHVVITVKSREVSAGEGR